MGQLTPGCTLTPWFPYSGAKSIDELQRHADLLSGISIFGKQQPDAAFFAACRDAGIDTMRLVGGKPDEFDTPAHARATTDRFLRLCDEVSYGGIDLDYEHIPAEYVGAYAEFMGMLSSELHGTGRRMSICLHGLALAEYHHPPTVQFYDPAVIAETCDEVRVMCYDYYFAPHGVNGPTTDWLWAHNVMAFWLQYIPLENMVMGLPAYGNDFIALPNAGHGRQVSYEHPSDVKGAHDIEQAWLHRERLNFYRYRDAEERPHDFYATDEASTRELLAIVDEMRVPMISFWHYGSMTPGIWRALEAWRNE